MLYNRELSEIIKISSIGWCVSMTKLIIACFPNLLENSKNITHNGKNGGI